MLINIFHGFAAGLAYFDYDLCRLLHFNRNSSAIKNFEATIDHSVKSYNATAVLTFHAMLL